MHYLPSRNTQYIQQFQAMAGKGSKDRKFYDISTDEHKNGNNYDDTSFSSIDDKSKLVQYVSDNVIGRDTTFLSPFGRKKIVYCDYTASGKSLACIENFISSEVLPLYGNTHTTTTVTSLQTTLYR